MAKDDTKTDTVIVELKRAHWIGEERHEAGELIEVDIDTALKLTSNGVATRTDPIRAN
jgi:hypothetical protein